MGPLTTEETEEQITKWVQAVKSRSQMTEKFQSDSLSLNLQENHQGILVSRAYSRRLPRVSTGQRAFQ